MEQIILELCSTSEEATVKRSGIEHVPIPGAQTSGESPHWPPHLKALQINVGQEADDPLETPGM